VLSKALFVIKVLVTIDFTVLFLVSIVVACYRKIEAFRLRSEEEILKLILTKAT